jgi:hypothetical protein
MKHQRNYFSHGKFHLETVPLTIFWNFPNSDGCSAMLGSKAEGLGKAGFRDGAKPEINLDYVQIALVYNLSLISTALLSHISRFSGVLVGIPPTTASTALCSSQAAPSEVPL